jgi:hypothetical protein
VVAELPLSARIITASLMSIAEAREAYESLASSVFNQVVDVAWS